jgi:hypothetical protein
MADELSGFGFGQNFPASEPDGLGRGQQTGKLVQPELRLRFEICPQGIGNLFGALAKARKVFKPVLKTSSNPFFKSKYADLAEVIDATKDGLSDNDLAITQPCCFLKSDQSVEVHTFMGHKSGEWIHSILEMPVTKQDAQGVGSAITYGRRYAYSGMVSVASEVDDDGEGAVARPAKEINPVEYDKRTESPTCIAEFQINALRDALQTSGKTEEDLKTYLGLAGYKRLQDVLKSDFNDLIKWANTKSHPDGKAPAKGGYNWPAVFAKAREKGYSESDVKDYYKTTYGVESGTQLTAKQFAELSVTVSQWKTNQP